MEAIASSIPDLASLLRGIPNGVWVAISEKLRKLVAYGVDAQAVLNEAHSTGEPNPLILRVPDQTAMFY